MERRRAERFSMSLAVEYETMDEFLQDYTANVSIGGIFIVTDKPFEKGASFRLRFCLPGREEPVRAKGTVAWVVKPGRDQRGRPGMGVSFTDISERDLASIQRLLDSWEPDDPWDE